MPPLRQEVEAGAAGLDPGALARLDLHFARQVDEGGCPGSWWPSRAAAASPI